MSEDSWMFGRRTPAASPTPVRRQYTSPIFSLVSDHREPKSLPIRDSLSPLPTRKDFPKSPSSLFSRTGSVSTPSLVQACSSFGQPLPPERIDRRSRFAYSYADLFPTEPKSKSRPHSSASMDSRRPGSSQSLLARSRSLRARSPLAQKTAWSSNIKTSLPKLESERTKESDGEKTPTPSKSPLPKVPRQEESTVSSTITTTSVKQQGHIVAKSVSTTSVMISKNYGRSNQQPPPAVILDDKHSKRSISPELIKKKEVVNHSSISQQKSPALPPEVSKVSKPTTTTRKIDVMHTIEHERKSKENVESPMTKQYPSDSRPFVHKRDRSPIVKSAPKISRNGTTEDSSRLDWSQVNIRTTPISKSSQHRIHIKGGKIVNDDGIIDADVFIEEGVIRQVGPNLIVPGGCRVVEAKGHYVIPGGIDPHTHFDTSFMSATTADDFYHGTRAALAGGTTTIINHALLPSVGPIEAFRRFKAKAEGKVCCDYALHVAITDFKDGQTEKDMESLIREGVNSFKVFMAYKDSLQLSDGQLIKVFDACKRLGAVPLVHAENGDVIDFLSRKLVSVGITGPEAHLQSRPEEIEAEATHRAITMANQVGSPVYIVHVMSKSAADEISRGRARGAVVFGETITAALGADGAHVFNRCWKHAAAHVMSPPIREDKTIPDYLMNLLGSGQLQITGSDHCVFSQKDKALGEKDFRKIPNGVNGVEERLSIIWEGGVKSGKLSLPDFVAVTSSNAAKLFNMYPKKGRIAPGSDADVVVWGRKPGVISKSTHHSSVDFNIFEGIATEFNPIVVIAGGRVVLDEEGKLQTIQGAGKYIPRNPNPHIAFSRLIQRDLNLGPIKVDRSPAALEAAAKAAAAATSPIVSGDVRNGNDVITLKKPVSSPLNIVTSLDSIRSEPPTAHSPSSSSAGSLTPTGFHRISTRSGVRSQQDSGFKLTGQQIDDDQMRRTSVKLHQPPGGKS